MGEELQNNDIQSEVASGEQPSDSPETIVSSEEVKEETPASQNNL